MNFFIKFPQFLFLSLCLSCTQLHIKDQESIPVTLSPKSNFTKRVQIEGKFEYYLWGLYPRQGRILYVDKILERNGVIRAGNVSVTRFRDGYDILYSLLSFGMYTPLSYSVTAFEKAER